MEQIAAVQQIRDRIFVEHRYKSTGGLLENHRQRAGWTDGAGAAIDQLEPSAPRLISSGARPRRKPPFRIAFTVSSSAPPANCWPPSSGESSASGGQVRRRPRAGGIRAGRRRWVAEPMIVEAAHLYGRMRQDLAVQPSERTQRRIKPGATSVHPDDFRALAMRSGGFTERLVGWVRRLGLVAGTGFEPVTLRL